MPPTTRRTLNGGIIRRWHGVVTADDQVTSSADFTGLAQDGPLHYAIVDYRDVERFEPRRHDVQRVAESMAGVPHGMRLAVIAPHDLVYGLVRMFDLSISDGPWIIHVVRSVDEAITWLGEEFPGVDFSEARAALED